VHAAGGTAAVGVTHCFEHDDHDELFRTAAFLHIGGRWRHPHPPPR
jgi:hypothetical protein